VHSANNMKIDRSKSLEIIFTEGRRQRTAASTYQRVTSMKILGVNHLSNHLSVMATFHYTIQVADLICDLVADLLARASSLLAS